MEETKMNKRRDGERERRKTCRRETEEDYKGGKRQGNRKKKYRRKDAEYVDNKSGEQTEILI